VTEVTGAPVERPWCEHIYAASAGVAAPWESTSMSMFEAWAIWSRNQPDRIAEKTMKRESRERPVATLNQLNERTLHDIGVSKLGFPIGRH
jgi:uncharacterized protein YjiS (DUF1127 family)